MLVVKLIVIGNIRKNLNPERGIIIDWEYILIMRFNLIDNLIGFGIYTLFLFRWDQRKFRYFWLGI